MNVIASSIAVARGLRRREAALMQARCWRIQNRGGVWREGKPEDRRWRTPEPVVHAWLVGRDVDALLRHVVLQR